MREGRCVENLVQSRRKKRLFQVSAKGNRAYTSLHRKQGQSGSWASDMDRNLQVASSHDGVNPDSIANFSVLFPAFVSEADTEY